MKDLARALRKNQTDAERLLWSRLRNRRFMNYKFRRQQTIGPYIADFLCMEPKLIIELDGGQHLERQQCDAERTQYLQALGYRVLRFWNNDVLNNLEGVLENLRLALDAQLTRPNSLPSDINNNTIPTELRNQSPLPPGEG